MVDTTYQNISTTQNLPDWYTSYLQDVMGRAQGAAGAEYQQYTGPMVAGLTPDQQQSYGLLRGGMGQSQAYINQAGGDYNAAAAGRSGLAGSTSLTNAASLFNSGAGANTAGAFSPYATDAMQYAQSAGDLANPLLRQSTTALGLQQASPYVQQSTQALGLQQANPYVQQSTQALGMQAANPYLQQASGSFPQNAAAYMSPYTQQVTDRIAELGGRNLRENLLPQISDQFVRAGQYGSAQQRDVVGRALRDTNESVLGQQAQALEQGYGQAGQLYEQDTARQGQLAGTAGQLGTQQQQILQQAGLGLGGLGTSQQQILQQAGLGLGGLGTQQQGLLQSAGLGMGNLALNQGNLTSNIGSTYAGLQGQDASRQIAAGQGLAGIGQTQIGASQADLARLLSAGQGIAGLGQDYTNNTMRYSAGLDASGQEQQANTQANYNAAYGQFQQQQQYPWQMVGNLSNVIQGLPVNMSTQSSSQSSAPGPSTVSQVAGLGVGVAGLANSGIFRAKGGAVKADRKEVKYKRSHSYGNTPKRGLGVFMEAA